MKDIDAYLFEFSMPLLCSFQRTSELSRLSSQWLMRGGSRSLLPWYEHRLLPPEMPVCGTSTSAFSVPARAVIRMNEEPGPHEFDRSVGVLGARAAHHPVPESGECWPLFLVGFGFERGSDKTSKGGMYITCGRLS